jgi:serine protease Do
VVLKIDAADVDSASDLTRRVALAHAAEKVQLEIRCDGRVRQIDVRSGVRPTEASLTRSVAPDRVEADTQADARKVLGMRLEPKPGGGGVTIGAVADNSDAGEKGLRGGDVILRAGDAKTNAPADVVAAVAAARREGRKSVLLMINRGGGTIFVPLKVDEGQGSARRHVAPFHTLFTNSLNSVGGASEIHFGLYVRLSIMCPPSAVAK